MHRDRSAVKRDVDELERAGLYTLAQKPLPGHGVMKEVRVTARQIGLQALMNRVTCVGRHVVLTVPSTAIHNFFARALHYVFLPEGRQPVRLTLAPQT